MWSLNFPKGKIHNQMHWSHKQYNLQSAFGHFKLYQQVSHACSIWHQPFPWQHCNHQVALSMPSLPHSRTLAYTQELQTNLGTHSSHDGIGYLYQPLVLQHELLGCQHSPLNFFLCPQSLTSIVLPALYLHSSCTSKKACPKYFYSAWPIVMHRLTPSNCF